MTDLTVVSQDWSYYIRLDLQMLITYLNVPIWPKALTFQLEIFNAEVLFREDATPDDFIDVVVGNRVYMPCLYVRELLCLH